MTRLELQTAISNLSQVTSQNILIQQSLNFALNRIYSAFDFPYYLQDDGVIKFVPIYEVGTIEVINGSPIIRGTGTSWTSSMVGRKMKIGNAFYRILTVDSSTQITLEQPFQGASPDRQTVLLLAFNGTDASTSFLDTVGKTITPQGNAQIDTAQYKFGGASGLFAGDGDYLSTPDSDDWSFGTENFTIDFRVRFNSLTNQMAFCGQISGGGANYWLIKKGTNADGNKLALEFQNASVNKGVYVMTSAWSNIAINTWYHLTFIRNGATALILIDGVSQPLTETTAFGTNDVGNIASTLEIGSYNSGSLRVDGWLDEFRISKGIARWIADFTPPTSAYGPLSAESYTIFQDEYRLASDLDKYKTFRQMQNSIALFQFPITTFDELHPRPASYANPIYAMMVGTKLDTYSTGTVSATVGTSVITGSGTSWTTVEGLGRLSKITIPNAGVVRNVYTIKSVDSDTQITIYETLAVTVAASTTYLITLNNVRVQLYQIPNVRGLLYYRYFRIPEPLSNDWDIPDLPHSWHWLLIYGALSFIYLYKGDMQNAQLAAELRFKEGINDMKIKLGSFAPDMIYKRKSIDRIAKGRMDGLETPNYDRRYSAP